MRLLYINISRSNSPGVSDFLQVQRHSLSYKTELAENNKVHYLLRNKVPFELDLGKLKVIAQKMNKLAFIIYAARHAKRHDFKVIIVHGLQNFMFVPLLRMLGADKLLMQHHNERTYAHKIGRLMRFTAPFIDGFFFNGIEVARPFLMTKCLREDQVIEVSEAATTFDYRDRTSDAVKRIVFVGRLDSNKDAATLIRAIAILGEGHYRVDIYYGANDLERELKDFCIANDLLNRVHFNGKVNSDEMQQIMNDSDIFVSCSLYESCGFALIEALACGLYPVVTEIGAFNFLLQGLDHKRQFGVRDHNALAHHLNSVLQMDLDWQIKRDIRMHFERKASPAAVASQVEKALTSLF
jgi:glycosyltransferase involved in cell wall biosynthesis